MKQYLDGEWSLSFTSPDGERVETHAPVPGNIEPVLQRLGLIGDYLPAHHDRATERFDMVDDFCYSTVFEFSREPGFDQCLVFEGIDTIAEIYLNGSVVSSVQNMHETHRIPLDGLAREGENRLSVLIRSAELWARQRPHAVFIRNRNEVVSHYDSYAYLRKVRHAWGWDNAPRLLTSGIHRSVYVEKLPCLRFDDVYLYTGRVDGEYVSVGSSWHFLSDRRDLTALSVRFSLLDGDRAIGSCDAQVRHVQGNMELRLPREQVRLWWPIGFGEPYLYTARMELIENGRTLAAWERPFGIRTLTLTMSDDLDSGKGEFLFRVNGESVYIRGTNWKPLDPLPSVADRKTKEGSALCEAKRLHCNMIRIWGGGFYEDEFFFDWCDRNGMLIWQDFMFACEKTPVDEDFCRLVAKEAEQIVRKYRNHPSLALWCGDNENDLSMTWGSTPSRLMPSDFTVSRRVLREAVLRNDPFRDYVPSSPYFSDRAYACYRDENPRYEPIEAHLYPNCMRYGSALRSLGSVFIGETGPLPLNAVSVCRETLERERARAERLWDSPCLPSNGTHQDDGYFTIWRNVGREMCLDRYGRDFSFAEWEDYAIAVNLICAEIYKDAIEYCRAVPHKTGVIWWSLTDMWPMLFNYSVTDCKGRYKLPAHFIRRSQEPVALLAVREKEDGPLVLYASNDTLREQTIRYQVTAYGTDGSSAVLYTGTRRQEKNSTDAIIRLDVPKEPTLLILSWQTEQGCFCNHAFTGFTDYGTMKSWLSVIEREYGAEGEFAELNP